MDWTKNTDCQLIVVGESKDGQPFCYEEKFTIDKIGEDSFTVFLELSVFFPFDKLEHVSFIEFSFRERGILYYTYVDLLQLEVKKSICYLTLSIPEEIHQHQNRQYNRVKLSLRTPITLQIVGIRGLSARKGVAFSGQLLDISAGGLSFVTTNRLFYPLFLEFSFILPGFPHPITAYGEIVRVSNFSNDSYRVATEFRHTPDSILQEIDKYCSLD
ncbi:hypothetical protein GCM10008018_23430 [Paenibacillus marchantiophytorum]|uniref:PilZ domain-containing protein n=1 Tax=Paenibacillus marchantiophytorum TaxID=1619310 RepID=A0ABQ1ELY3_9BACL|nr:PilZ domain-containing protein [Paenibacillus marchantiophytorum]GFZ77198.1 hypothetical protein GCM10008018_23430 [Paenibacillus marchantiophytorum]